MKKTLFILLFASLAVCSHAQRGNLSVGVKGGYVYSSNYFRDYLYGANVDYHLTDALELAFTGLMNPQAKFKHDTQTDKFKVYSLNLDARLYLLNMRTWGMGPALGGQYLYTYNTTDNYKDVSTLGFNLGWHTRFNITDNVRINAGWRYTNIKDKTDYRTNDIGHHLFYAGVTYTFELF